MTIALFVAMLVLAYLIGAIPFGVLVGRLAYGVDVREHGSGNVGTTNVFRVLGKKAGVAVFVLDVCKGFLPALVATLVARACREHHEARDGLGVVHRRGQDARAVRELRPLERRHGAMLPRDAQTSSERAVRRRSTSSTVL